MNRILIRHFLVRLFALEAEEREDDERLGAGPMLAMLTVPGALLSFLLFPKYSALLRYFNRSFGFDPDAASLADKHLFLALAMAAAGIATVLKWETLFPDRRDFANLAPLPISTRRLFLAKLAALCVFLGAVAFASNAAPAVVFPALVLENSGTVKELLRFYFAHASAILAISSFACCVPLAAAGILTGLPGEWARRLSRAVQVCAVGGLLVSLLSAAAPGGRPIAPVSWFLGLYLELQGRPAFWSAEAATRAVWATLASFAATALAWNLAYRRFGSGNAISSRFRARPSLLHRAASAAADCSSRDSFHRAIVRFTLLTLLRDNRHSAVLAAGGGVAVSYSLAALASGSPALGLALIYCTLLSLRMALGIPAYTRANWQITVTGLDPEASVRSAVSAVFYVALALCVLLSAPVSLIWWDAGTAVSHGVFLFAAGAVFAEILAAGVRAVPCTLHSIPGADNPVFSLTLCAAGLLLFAEGLALVEIVLLRSSAGVAVFAALAAAACWGVRMRFHAPGLVLASRQGSFDLLRLSE